MTNKLFGEITLISYLYYKGEVAFEMEAINDTFAKRYASRKGATRLVRLDMDRPAIAWEKNLGKWIAIAHG